jgi:hypothetical protein
MSGRVVGTSKEKLALGSEARYYEKPSSKGSFISSCKSKTTPVLS